MVRPANSAPLPLRSVAPANEGGALLAKRYRLDELLGRGGMGEVWAAYDVELDRHVAIKLIQLKLADHPDFARRFITETRTAACLHHANIPQIYTTDSAPDGRLYMVMQRVRGITLRQAIDTHGRVPAVHAVCYVIHAADAVACAHLVGICHRDIKPENIMVSEDDGRAWLLDFGIAKRTTESAGERAAAALGGRIKSTALGTIGYVPPEVARGGKADHRGDLYQLGVTLYEAILGEKPYPAPEDDTTAMLSAHVFDDPAPARSALPACVAGDPAAAPGEGSGGSLPERGRAAGRAARAVPRDRVPSSDPTAKALHEDREQQVLRQAFASVPSPAESARRARRGARRADRAKAVQPAAEGQPRTLPLAQGSAARSPRTRTKERVNGRRSMSAGFVPVSPAHPSSSPERRGQVGPSRDRNRNRSGGRRRRRRTWQDPCRRGGRRRRLPPGPRQRRRPPGPRRPSSPRRP